VAPLVVGAAISIRAWGGSSALAENFNFIIDAMLI
jgi:hypothetical protein